MLFRPYQLNSRLLIMTLGLVVSVLSVCFVVAVVIISLLRAFGDFHYASLLIIFGEEATAGYQSTDHDHRWEIVLAAQLFEANNMVNSNTVNETYDGWQHLDLQFGHEEGTLFSINLDNQGLSMTLHYLLHVHVYDLASFEVFVEEMNDGILSLGYTGQEFLLRNFAIGTMALLEIFNLLFLLCFQFLHSLEAEALNDLIVTVGIEVRITIVILCTFFFNLTNTVQELGLLHFFLHLRRLVLDSFLHHHFVENISCNLHSSASHTGSSISLCHFKF